MGVTARARTFATNMDYSADMSETQRMRLVQTILGLNQGLSGVAYKKLRRKLEMLPLDELQRLYAVMKPEASKSRYKSLLKPLGK